MGDSIENNKLAFVYKIALMVSLTITLILLITSFILPDAVIQGQDISLLRLVYLGISSIFIITLLLVDRDFLKTFFTSKINISLILVHVLLGLVIMYSMQPERIEHYDYLLGTINTIVYCI